MTVPIVITVAQQSALAEGLDRAFRARLGAAHPDMDAAACDARLAEARAAGFGYEADILGFFALHATLDAAPEPPEGADLARAILRHPDMPAGNRIAAATEVLGPAPDRAPGPTPDHEGEP